MALVAPEHPEPLEQADALRLDIGGAESNVAAHLADAGVPTAWVSALGDDALGRRVPRVLRERGVDLRWLRIDDQAATGVYFKDPGRGVLYYRAGSAASRMSADTIADIPLEQMDLVHISGITPILSPSCAALIDAVFDRLHDASTVTSFDVNYRAPLWPVAEAAPVLRSLSSRADLVLVGLDEAQTLWGCETDAQVREFLPEPHRLVVKDGAVGATEFTGSEQTFVAACAVEVVEAVGAGDAFAGGYLAALLAGDDPAERLAAGHRRAARVLRSMTDYLEE